MTIEERANEIFEVCDMMVKIATEQRYIDLKVVEFVLYNAMEIGDVSCKDVKKLIKSIKQAMNNPPESVKQWRNKL